MEPSSYAEYVAFQGLGLPNGVRSSASRTGVDQSSEGSHDGDDFAGRVGAPSSGSSVPGDDVRWGTSGPPAVTGRVGGSSGQLAPSEYIPPFRGLPLGRGRGGESLGRPAPSRAAPLAGGGPTGSRRVTGGSGRRAADPYYLHGDAASPLLPKEDDDRSSVEGEYDAYPELASRSGRVLTQKFANSNLDALLGKVRGAGIPGGVIAAVKQDLEREDPETFAVLPSCTYATIAEIRKRVEKQAKAESTLMDALRKELGKKEKCATSKDEIQLHLEGLDAHMNIGDIPSTQGGGGGIVADYRHIFTPDVLKTLNDDRTRHSNPKERQLYIVSTICVQAHQFFSRMLCGKACEVDLACAGQANGECDASKKCEEAQILEEIKTAAQDGDQDTLAELVRELALKASVTKKKVKEIVKERSEELDLSSLYDHVQLPVFCIDGKHVVYVPRSKAEHEARRKYVGLDTRARVCIGKTWHILGSPAFLKALETELVDTEVNGVALKDHASAAGAAALLAQCKAVPMGFLQFIAAVTYGFGVPGINYTGAFLVALHGPKHPLPYVRLAGQVMDYTEPCVKDMKAALDVINEERKRFEFEPDKQGVGCLLSEYRKSKRSKRARDVEAILDKLADSFVNLKAGSDGADDAAGVYTPFDEA